jgi:hypothetical protein
MPYMRTPLSRNGFNVPVTAVIDTFSLYVDVQQYLVHSEEQDCRRVLCLYQLAQSEDIGLVPISEANKIKICISKGV